MRFLLGWLFPALLMAAAPLYGQEELRLLPSIYDVEAFADSIQPIQTETAVEAAAAPVEVVAPADGATTDVLLDAEDVIEPQWFYPSVMADYQYWTGSIEFGTNGTAGNTQTLSYRLGADFKHKAYNNTFGIGFNYTQGTADGVENVNNGMLIVRDDWDFCDSLWSLFAKGTVEYDEFKAFGLRLTANAGIGYYVLKNDITSLKFRLGSGTSKEFDSADENWIPEAVVGFDYERKLTLRQSFEAHGEYLPEWGDYANYRFDSRASWSIQLDDAKNLNLKISIIDRYDSTSFGRKPNDFEYAMLLMWKM